jgi:predicted RNA-binding protein with EMAP domain
MPSQPVTALALVIVALALVLVVGAVGSNWLAPHAEKVDVRVGAVQMVRALGDRYLLVVSVVNVGTVPVTVQTGSLSLRGEGNPTCARLGFEYLVTIPTDRGVQAWAKAVAVG